VAGVGVGWVWVGGGVGETWMVHICGIVLLAGRLMHYYGFHHRLFRWRRSGMSATWCALLLMVLANLWYMPWELVFSLR
ncbi:MAPEG family protein, partial [Ligilactobacillus salivarius]|nr:MAPEG family protein [Ligilactobacillus salivarius]